MNKEAEKEKIRTSLIKKSIRRTIQTAKFESLTIEHGIEETIDWKTPSERSKKITNWETLLLQEFKQCHDRILLDLGFDEKKAFFDNATPETIKKIQTKTEEESDNILDSLDTIG